MTSTADFCPRERTGNAAGMTRRRALGLAGAALAAMTRPRLAGAEETIVVCKATTEMDRPYELQTIERWELEEFDLYPAPADGCPETCPSDEAEICAGRCGDVEVTCGRFASVVGCPECPNEGKAAASRGADRKKTAKKRKKRPARG